MEPMKDLCTGPLADVLRVLNSDFGWVCEPVADSHALILTGRRYADSEPVTVHVFAFQDILVLSDGGETAARLHSAGFDLDDTVNAVVWREALHEFRVAFDGGLVQVSASLRTAAHSAARLADALVGLDTLRLLAAPSSERPRTFADEVEAFLRRIAGDAAVTRSPRVEVEGIAVRPTLQVVAKTGPVYVQATATTAYTQAFEHAFYMFSLLNRADIPKTSRLAVLGGSESTWTRPRLNVLSEVAYVGLWASSPDVEAFLSGQTIENPLPPRVWSA